MPLCQVVLYWPTAILAADSPLDGDKAPTRNDVSPSLETLELARRDTFYEISSVGVRCSVCAWRDSRRRLHALRPGGMRAVLLFLLASGAGWGIRVAPCGNRARVIFERPFWRAQCGAELTKSLLFAEASYLPLRNASERFHGVRGPAMFPADRIPVSESTRTAEFHSMSKAVRLHFEPRGMTPLS